MSSVTHFGPDPTSTGGMATVISTLIDAQVGADTVDFVATWHPSSTIASGLLTIAAGFQIATSKVGGIAHFHLSERGSFIREGSLLMLARSREIPTVATIHGASFVTFASTRPAVVRAVLGRADLVTCLDSDTLATVHASVPSVPAEIVPNPARVDDEPSPADHTEEIVVFAGEIGRRKGADVLARAWRLVARRRPRARCLIVGPPGDYEPPSIERLELRPAVGQAEMSEILRRARVIALPSRAEAMPMILTEAMSLGRPFVSTPVGGIPELTEGGLIVPVEDEASLADCLTELLARPELALRIGERGRTFCAQTRSVAVIGSRLRGLYAEAESAHARHRGLSKST